MSLLAGVVWWVVLGVLLGWLASWLVGRGPRRPLPTPIERVVERTVDNPEHLERIAALEQAAADAELLRERVRALESAAPAVVERVVERVVEKTVERPVDGTLEKVVPDTEALAERDRQIEQWRERHDDLMQQLVAQRRRASELEGQVLRLRPPAVDLDMARAAGIALDAPDDFRVIAGIDDAIAARLRSEGIDSFHELARSAPARLRAILSDAGPDFRSVDPDGWPELALLAAHNHWRALKQLGETQSTGARTERERRDLESQVRVLKGQLAECNAELAKATAVPVLDRDAARAAGFEPRHDDDLEIIAGVRAPIAAVLRDAGIRTFRALAQLTPDEIKSALERGGPNFRLIDPQTWSDQALLAAQNRWASLAVLQAALATRQRK